MCSEYMKGYADYVDDGCEKIMDKFKRTIVGLTQSQVPCQLASTQLTLGSYVVQIWSRYAKIRA